MSVIGIDTSNYTTSIAFFDGVGGEICSRLLPVKQGELGLRQSDSPICFFQRAGPMNMENSLTWTPESFAAAKWPNSWIKIRKLNKRIAKRTLIDFLA